MTCSNCGMINNDDSEKCVGCGNELRITKKATMVDPIANNLKVTEEVPFMSYFGLILSIILKPFTTMKDNLKKFDDFKNSLNFALFVSLVATIISLIKKMMDVVIITNTNWFTGATTTTWFWANLKGINYISVIGKAFLLYIGIIFAIAVVYYIGSLIIKKEINFSRLLGIAVASITPILISVLILSPLLSIIYAPLSGIVTIIGGVYTLIILYEMINNEITLKDDLKFYFNLVCLSLLVLTAYYVYMKSITGSLFDLLSR
ncbi:MAG: hypothetical protein PHI05_00215 [Bacilli bacterium]|nr:hypothetical protein [Bacilli bacterium]MDD4547163.1 hypothetical protein [Bacilli bacterium]